MAATDVILGFLVQFNGVVGNGMPLFVSVRAFGDLLEMRLMILHRFYTHLIICLFSSDSELPVFW